MEATMKAGRQGLDDPLHAVFIRGPWVERHGPGVEVLAAVHRGDRGSRPVVVRQGALLAASFHPELGSDHRLHQMFVRSVHAKRDAASR